jgi:hypothetical protein
MGGVMRAGRETSLMLLFAISVANVGCSPLSGNAKAENVAVTVTGVQHMGNNYSISSFNVNGYYWGNVGRGGGGGSFACCMMLPEKWRPDLSVVVKWTIKNWMNSSGADAARGDYSSVKNEGTYIATVPIEKYDEPGDIYVHFFSRNRARVISTNYGAFGKGHPILKDARDEDVTIQGKLVPVEDTKILMQVSEED